MQISKHLFKIALRSLVKAKQLTRAQGAALKMLASYSGRKGCFPAVATVAAKSSTSRDTVFRAVKIAEEMGILLRWHRYEDIGHRRARTSNGYRLTMTRKFFENALKMAEEFEKFLLSRKISQKPFYILRTRRTDGIQSPQFSRTELLNIVGAWGGTTRTGLPSPA